MTLHFSNAAKKLVNVDSDLSMTGTNCYAFLQALGYTITEESYFATTAEDFLHSLNCFINSQLPSLIDNGSPTIEAGNFISFGRSEGYLMRRAQLAKQMTIEAIEKGAIRAYFI